MDIYCNLLQTHASIFWIVYSILQASLNLPTKLNNIFVIDVIRCYESIPLTRKDNLSDTLAFILLYGYHHAATLHLRAVNMLWLKLLQDGMPFQARWYICPLLLETWLYMPQD